MAMERIASVRKGIGWRWGGKTAWAKTLTVCRVALLVSLAILLFTACAKPPVLYRGPRTQSPAMFALPTTTLELMPPGTRIGVIPDVCVMEKRERWRGETPSVVCGDLPAAVQPESIGKSTAKLAGVVLLGLAVGLGGGPIPDLGNLITPVLAHHVCRHERSQACVPVAPPYHVVAAARFGTAVWSQEHELMHLRGYWCHSQGAPSVCDDDPPVLPAGKRPVTFIATWDGQDVIPDAGRTVPDGLIRRVVRALPLHAAFWGVWRGVIYQESKDGVLVDASDIELRLSSVLEGTVTISNLRRRDSMGVNVLEGYVGTRPVKNVLFIPWEFSLRFALADEKPPFEGIIHAPFGGGAAAYGVVFFGNHGYEIRVWRVGDDK